MNALQAEEFPELGPDAALLGSIGAGRYSSLPRLVFNNFRPNSCWLSVRRFFIIKSELKNCAKTCRRRSASPASLKLNLWPLSMAATADNHV